MAGIDINKTLSKRLVKLKILSVVFGLLALILAHNYLPLSEEEAFDWASMACLAVSVVISFFTLAGLFQDIDILHSLDKFYHIIASIVIIVTASFYIVSVIRFEKAWKIAVTNDGTVHELNYERRISAGAFGLFYGFTCGIIALFLSRLN